MACFFKRKFTLLLIIGLVFTLTLGGISPPDLNAQTSEIPSTSQDDVLRHNKLQSQELEKAIAHWEELLTQSSTNALVLHNNLAAAYRQKGQLPQAIAHWQELIGLVEGDDPRSQTRLVTALVDQAQAYIALGQTRLAIPQLREALKRAEALHLGKAKALATKALGNAYYRLGSFDQAIAAYTESLQAAMQLNDSSLRVAALNNLSNAHAQRQEQYLLRAQYAKAEGTSEENWSESAQQEQEAALAAARQAVQVSQGTQSLSAVRARLQLMRLEPSLNYSPQVIAILRQLPASGSKVFLLIELAQFEEPTAAVNHLKAAVTLASELGDLRSQSYALGELAKIYEQHHQYEPALKLAQQAQEQAQGAMALESLYQWQWLAGKIYRATGNLEESKQAYRGAVTTLQDLRSNIMAAPESLQFKFREQVEPVYRELLGLLLASDDASQITEAIDVFQLLQLKELQNFFGDECIEVEQMPDPSEVLAQTNLALIRTIVLDAQTYVILQLPNGLKSYAVDISAGQLTDELFRWRFQLENLRLHGEYKPLSEYFYNLLLRPLEQDLAAANPDTVVFINDGLLRNVPMAALSDGQQFLVEKYPLAVSLGFHLNVKSPSSQNLHPLIFGLTEAVDGWPPLPNVDVETENIKAVLGGDKYLNQEFTLARLKEEVKEDYPVIHLATHGQFVGTAVGSYLQAYDERIPIEAFEQILSRSDRPINLLTLSACQTAAGNERSVLGMAGVAARAGVEKILGSLWYLNDAENVTLLTDFYQNLKQPGISEAHALRKAQLQQIADPRSHPSIWASLILIGDWF